MHVRALRVHRRAMVEKWQYGVKNPFRKKIAEKMNTLPAWYRVPGTRFRPLIRDSILSGSRRMRKWSAHTGARTELILRVPIPCECTNHGGNMMSTARYCILCSVLLLVQGVVALSVTVTPDHVVKGDLVTISIDDLPDNTTFLMQIEGTFAAVPGGSFSFETRNLVLPFSLNEGSLSATLRNTETNVLIVRRGDTEVKKVGLSSNGIFTATESGSIPKGTYDTISLGGTAAADARSIVAGMTLQGRKSGPSDSEITFIVEGVTDGRVTVSVGVGGETASVHTIQVGNPVTGTPTHPPSGGGGGGGGSTGSSAPATAAATIATTAATTTATTTIPSSPAATSPSEGMTTAATMTVTGTSTPQEQRTTASSSPAGPGLPLSSHVAAAGTALAVLILASKRH